MTEFVYRCPACKHEMVVCAHVKEVIHTGCPERKPRHAAPVRVLVTTEGR